MMDECPHCGEPLQEKAESCPHCGSDFETGWKPDTDYYAVELPEEDPLLSQEAARRASTPAWEAAVHAALLCLCFLLFVGAYGKSKEAVFIPFAILLVICALLFRRWTLRRRAPPAAR